MPADRVCHGSECSPRRFSPWQSASFNSAAHAPSFATQNWYDVWYPNLAPSPETVKQAQAAATPQEWAAFVRKYRAEMATPENRHTLALLARMSQDANFSVGCYCEDESHCHRSVLRELLAEAGAQITP